MPPAPIAIAVFAALSIYCAIHSEAFIANDACMHFLSARYAFVSPQNFVDVWNRPLVVALYSAPAWFGGRAAVRCVALLLAIGCALVAQRIAKIQGAKWPVLALIFTLGQPMLFLHSFGEMTELPFALLLGLAFLAYQRKRFYLAAAIIAWAPLARPEGFGIVLLLFIALMFHRKFAATLLLPIPVILWNLAGWYLVDSRTNPTRWLWDAWPYASQSLYGRGQFLALVGQLPAVVPPFALPAALIGIWLSFCPNSSTAITTEAKPARFSHERICRLLTAVMPVFILAAHTLLYWFGKAGSDGEARYLLVVAPFWGVVAARGWEWAFNRLKWNQATCWASAAALAAPIVANAVHPVVPVHLSQDWQTARQVAEWYRRDPVHAGYPKIMAAHPAIFYYLDINPYGSPQVRAFDKQTLAEHKPGTLLIWDPANGNRNSAAERAFTLEEVRKAGWIEFNAPQACQEWHLFVSPQVAIDLNN